MAETPKRQEIARRVERGEKLLQKGKAAEALEEFLEVLALDFSNDTVRQMAADLCLSLQRLPEAARLLGELFERQTAAGDATRASLTYKKLARFANPTCKQKILFAELLEKSNRRLAIETYEAVLEELLKQGHKADALVLLRKIAALDGSEHNIARLGELSAEIGDRREAAAAFLKLAQQAEAAGGNPAQWFERAYAEDAADEAIALGYAKCLLEQQQIGAAIFVLDPLASAGKTSPEFRELYAKALLRANRVSEAVPLVWEMFEQNPSRLDEVRDVIGALIDSELDGEAIALARKLEQRQRLRGERRAFLAMMQEIVGRHRPSVEALEFLAEQFNTANREAEYSESLLRLFDLYCREGNYLKAADALDRAAEIDAYEAGHQKRLELLRGKIDEARYQVIASRFGSAAPVAPVRNDERTLGTGTLQDLMLQAEILVQYGMRNKALERLQRIQQLFPHEEDRNPELHQLYLTAGMSPRYAGGASPPMAMPPAAVVAASAPTLAVADVSSLAHVPEITRKLNQENTAEGILITTAREIVRRWKLSRSIAALRRPGRGVGTIKEFVADGESYATGPAAETLICGLHELALSRGPLIYSEISSATELQAFRPQLMEFGVRSLAVLPLSNGNDELGVLLLIDSAPRQWSANDAVVLRMIAEQAAMALSNAGLRRLVKNLSVTDEHSGLLKRASYLDLLMGEVRRAWQQNTHLSVLLMDFGNRASLGRDYVDGEDSAMQRLGPIVVAALREKDLAFRYAANVIAVVLTETSEKESLVVVENLRRAIGSAFAEQESAKSFNAGIAQAVSQKEFDPLDIV
ncbi:MAG: tetratricopeptide repeat protein, partial [Acidobacteria bacterium]|nr:tetratricopeptide repeat protein [Acidobacteriota bacterium]